MRLMNKDELVTYEQAQEMIQNAGKDVESGMEYLYGTEVMIEGKRHYKKSYVETFINR